MTTKNRGLGKGIGAFFSDESNPFEKDYIGSDSQGPAQAPLDPDHEQVVEVALDEIRPNPYQPRLNFSEKALQELADSIAEQGLLQPIILRKSAIKGYEIIAGERRYRATKLNGAETIPAIVREMTDAQMIETAIIENLQREDLTPLEEAQAYQNLIDSLSLTQAEAAKRLGKSRSYIANYLRLLDLTPEVKELVQDGDLSMGQARTLLALKNPKDQTRLAKKVVNEGMTVRQLEKMVQSLNEPVEAQKSQKVQAPQKPTYIRESEDLLMDKFGTNVQIQSKGDHGKIEIEYLSEEDLTRILDLLNIRLDD
ncbi:ParB/RepB/Spo0J family partition protein [Aerococcus sanguinicola]|uniref:Chromosome partitioning protein ParB n=1 Tax=Aerococcus sanguinicola TaxID=119206 RepID=A0A0X8FCJ5_9LACT|nr:MULTISPECIES: ParB/RepB/Spo0J family partition protein [Aerococcus]AMB94027.1 chromosome partitioning protein ParB [Aerococcus sanguinicola]MDK7050670.1 ParB/RepB/Spo0J family partition protein [Aerococcus sanguinicola]OFT93645.1 chromosome partitioning protein ParB [Aerococcus sp. HMSC23C02]PKZ20796.1 chromosome partitioning protein ParB [Aerococcus sanguinicola]